MPSGRLVLRMPADLHEHLAELAAAQGVSLNALIVTLLAGASAWKLSDAA